MVKKRSPNFWMTRVLRHLPVVLVLEQGSALRLTQGHEANKQAWTKHNGHNVLLGFVSA